MTLFKLSSLSTKMLNHQMSHNLNGHLGSQRSHYVYGLLTYVRRTFVFCFYSFTPYSFFSLSLLILSIFSYFHYRYLFPFHYSILRIRFLYTMNTICIPESFNKNISRQLIDYIITFVLKISDVQK